MPGQINLDTAFGEAIKQISSDLSYSTFCEVGAWNGEGSTRCIYAGFLTRKDSPMLYSIEGDPSMFSKAKAVWGNRKQVTLLYGTLHRNVLSSSEVKSHPMFSKIVDHYRLWYDTEYATAQNSPLVTVPSCDVILLDGGEFSTEGDWNVLFHDDLKVVMLDDTQIMKTNRIYNQLKQDPSWECVHDYPQDRNGWAVFKKISRS